MKEFDPYKFVQERKESRPFNDRNERDGNWNYIHQTDVWSLIERMNGANKYASKRPYESECRLHVNGKHDDDDDITLHDIMGG